MSAPSLSPFTYLLHSPYQHCLVPNFPSSTRSRQAHNMQSWVCVVICAVLVTAIDPEFQTSDGALFQVKLSAYSFAQPQEGCRFSCAQSCVDYSAASQSGFNQLSAENVRNCVGYCGCGGLIQTVQSSSLIAMNAECTEKCSKMCIDDSPSCEGTCQQLFCAAHLPYSPDEEATEVLTIVADIVLVLVVLGAAQALGRKLLGKQKKKEWKSSELETSYQSLAY